MEEGKVARFAGQLGRLEIPAQAGDHSCGGHKSTWHLSEVKVKTRWLVVLTKGYSVLGKQEER